MPFDWLAFLDGHNIAHSTQQHSRGNIGVQCPWCGNSDPSYHLGINLSGHGYYCWRNETHSGKNPVRLVQALLGVSYETAKEIIGRDGNIIPADNHLSDIITKLGKASVRILRHSDKPTYRILQMPKSFHLIENYGKGKMYLEYLQRRGYSKQAAIDLAREYKLHYANDGKFAGRVIYPIYLYGSLITWTGRSISDRSPRYLTLSPNDIETPAILPITQTLFDYADLQHGHGTIVMVEGFFDALRINYFGRAYNIHATCTFGKRLYSEQTDLLNEVINQYNQRIILLDPDTWSNAMLSGSYSVIQSILQFKSVQLCEGAKDPAELTKEQFNIIFGY